MFYLLSIILISSLGIIVYSNSFHCSFQFDDWFYIINNFKNSNDLLKIWEFYPCRFITFLSILANLHFNGLNVCGYHFFNLAIHLGSAILLWWLVLMTLSTPVMKGDRINQHANLIALLAGLVFVSHPIQTEAVTYIWQRTASLAAFFYLASLCFYVKSRLLCHSEPEGRRTSKFVYYICALITAVLAMFTKELTITLPLMILFYEFSFLKTGKNLDWKYPAPFLLTLFIIPLTIMFLPKSVRLQEEQGVLAGLNVISPMHYLLTQFRVMVTYIRLVFLPFNQNLDYDYPIYKNFFEPPVLFSLFSLGLVLYMAQRLFSKHRLVSFSIFWFFLTLLPESSVVPFADVIFEHRLYLPLAGYSIFLVSSMYYILGKRSIKSMVIVLIMVITFYSFSTYQRNTVWKDGITLWNDAVRKSPHKARAYNNRGKAYLDQGHISQALADFNKAVALDPGSVEVYSNRGSAYIEQGNFKQALSDYNKVVTLDPNNAHIYSKRGFVYYKFDDLAQAIIDFNKAIELDPRDAEAYCDRGSVYGKEKGFTQAILDFTNAIKINPDYAEAYYNRAGTYYHLKEYGNAWADVRKAEKLGYGFDPGFISSLKKASGQDK